MDQARIPTVPIEYRELFQHSTEEIIRLRQTLAEIAADSDDEFARSLAMKALRGSKP